LKSLYVDSFDNSIDLSTSLKKVFNLSAFIASSKDVLNLKETLPFNLSVLETNIRNFFSFKTSRSSLFLASLSLLYILQSSEIKTELNARPLSYVFTLDHPVNEVLIPIYDEDLIDENCQEDFTFNEEAFSKNRLLAFRNRKSISEARVLFHFVSLLLNNTYEKVSNLVDLKSLTRKKKFMLEFYQLLASLFFTILLGSLFLICQIIEYTSHATFSLGNLYGSIFFFTTGLHGMHVFVGLVALILTFVRLYKGQFFYNLHPHVQVTCVV